MPPGLAIAHLSENMKGFYLNLAWMTGLKQGAVARFAVRFIPIHFPS